MSCGRPYRLLAGRPGTGPPGGRRGGRGAIAPFDVHRIAALARIHLSPEDGRRLGRQLGEVVGYLDRLPPRDDRAPEPAGGASGGDPAPRLLEHEDEPASGLPHQRFLANAPDSHDGFLRLPAVWPAAGAGEVEDDAEHGHA